MMNKLRKLLQNEVPLERLALAEHVQRGPLLRLPPGAIVAELGLRHLPEAAGGRTVQAQMDEAYVVVRTAADAHWYATWQPYEGGWELLRLEDDAVIAPEPEALPAPRVRRYN